MAGALLRVNKPIRVRARRREGIQIVFFDGVYVGENTFARAASIMACKSS